MSRSRRACSAAGLGITALFVLILAAPLAAQTPRVPVSAEVAARAAQEALNYARVSYPVEEQTRQGMPFRLGGQTTLEEFLDAVQAGRDPQSMGIDASGLVVNVYRSLLPGLTFLWQASPSGLKEATDASSQAIFYWNVDAVDLPSARPGDLLFFKGASGEPSGVAVITRVSPDRVDFVVASASKGRVIESFARPNGAYWRGHVLGLGRLLVPEGLEPHPS